MEHKPVEKLRSVAEVHELSQGFLSRRERLERWAEVLERQPKRRLRSLGEIEFVPKDKPSKSQQLQSWAWRAMKAGNVPVARKHAVALWKAAPLSVESWRTLLCAMRGH